MRPLCPTTNGFALIELVFVLATLALLLTATLVVSRPLLDRETLGSATFELQSVIQRSRMEAVSRNRDCRFLLRTDTRSLQIWDGMGSEVQGDDRLLYQTTLDSRVDFARPDAGPSVTLASLGESAFEAVLRADGTVASGHGEVALCGGESCTRVRLFVAGGTEVQRWDMREGWGP